MSRKSRQWPAVVRWLAVAALVVAVLVVISGLLGPITDLIARHDVGALPQPQRAAHLQSARETVRTQLLTLGAGVFAAGALWFTARNFILSREGQVTDRYTKAIEQLGAEKVDVRIGGIYALERVARDSARDHPTVMEVLSAFIREHSRDGGPVVTQGGGPARLAPADIEAAIAVLRRRNPKFDIEPVNLAGANLAGANLRRTQLVAAYLNGTDLTGADLDGANLTRAHLNRAKLIGATLVRADLTETEIAHADLTHAYLAGAQLNGSYLVESNLSDTDLGYARLNRTNLSRANLTDADLRHTHFTDSKLDGANLSGSNWTKGVPVPVGWERAADSGLLSRTAESGPRQVTS